MNNLNTEESELLKESLTDLKENITFNLKNGSLSNEEIEEQNKKLLSVDTTFNKISNSLGGQLINKIKVINVSEFDLIMKSEILGENKETIYPYRKGEKMILLESSTSMGNRFVACDNVGGYAYTCDFDTQKEAINYLLDIEEKKEQKQECPECGYILDGEPCYCWRDNNPQY